MVSLSPAITDILFNIGLGDKIVGVSAYCMLPEGIHKKIVGNMMKVDTLSVRPTHLIFQGPGKRFEHLKQLDPKIKLEAFHIETFADILNAVKRFGDISGRSQLATNAISAFKRKIEAVESEVSGLKKSE